MFENLRKYIKKTIKERKLNYAQIAKPAGIKESTIKCFMCRANDSRRIAERLADVFGIPLIYSNGYYDVLTENKIDIRKNSATANPRGYKYVQISQVIKTVSVIGTGKIDDPVIEITQYRTLDGKHLVTANEFIDSKEENEKNREKSC